MSDAEKSYQATPAFTLEEQIMNPCIAKNEREWWAAAEIERLSEANTQVWAEIKRLRDVMKTAIRQFEDGNLLSCHRTLCDEVHGRQK